jgi:transcriptional regulator with XRE-family HTH domain
MSRFSQMLDAEVKRRGKSERELARDFGWSQQAFNTWKTGSVPRQQFYQRIADFLRIPLGDVEMLTDEARTSTGNTKLPKMDPIYGKVTDRKEGRYAFNADGGGMRYPLTRYAIRIDTKILEPALLVGTKAWADPAIWPQVGNDVIAHSKAGQSWLGRLAAIDNGAAVLEHYTGGRTVTVKDIDAIHVIVMAERVGSAA